MSELTIGENKIIGKYFSQTWTNLSYVAGVITAVRKDNMVTLSFNYSGNNTTGTLWTVMTLPAIYRPIVNLKFEIVNAAVDSYVEVNTDGTIKINYNATALNNRGTVSYIALNN